MELTATTLARGRVRLEPLEEHHRAGLTAAAERDVSIFRLMPFPVAAQGYDGVFDWVLSQQRAGVWLPHVVFLDDQVVGQSCYLNPRPRDAGVEIGGTWYVRAAQGGIANPSAKFLLLGHAFACGAERVEFKTDATNAQSRAALLKLGCAFEGVHRHHMRRTDGSWRDSAWYSILREEWPDLRARLEARLAALS